MIFQWNSLCKNMIGVHICKNNERKSNGVKEAVLPHRDTEIWDGNWSGKMQLCAKGMQESEKLLM